MLAFAGGTDAATAGNAAASMATDTNTQTDFHERYMNPPDAQIVDFWTLPFGK
jgi:hypothetical protein